MNAIAAFLQRALRVDQSDECLRDIQRAIAIIDEMCEGEISPDRAFEMLEELAGIQARVIIEDVRKR